VQIKIRKPTLEETEEYKTTLGLEGDLQSRVALNEMKAILESAPIEGLIID